MEDRPSEMSLPCWSSAIVSLRFSVPTSAADVDNAVQTHRDMLLCDATYSLVKSVKGHGRGRALCILWLSSVLQPWDEDEDERATWKSQAPQALVAGVTVTMNCLRGILRMVSDVPGDMGSEPGHLELALPAEYMRNGVGAKGAPGTHLGTLNKAGAVMQKHVFEEKDWRCGLAGQSVRINAATLAKCGDWAWHKQILNMRGWAE